MPTGGSISTIFRQIFLKSTKDRKKGCFALNFIKLSPGQFDCENFASSVEQSRGLFGRISGEATLMPRKHLLPLVTLPIFQTRPNIINRGLMSMNLEELRNDISLKQKKGLPFIIASVVIWLLITIVSILDIPVVTKNLLVFCCSAPLMPISMLIAKIIKVNIFQKENPLGNLGFLFTMNQMLYLLIVMWVFSAVPEKMVMVYAMVFGAHLLPYSWLYKSKAYMVFAIAIPFVALTLGSMFNDLVVASALSVVEIVFTCILVQEVKRLSN